MQCTDSNTQPPPLCKAQMSILQPPPLGKAQISILQPPPLCSAQIPPLLCGAQMSILQPPMHAMHRCQCSNRRRYAMHRFQYSTAAAMQCTDVRTQRWSGPARFERLCVSPAGKQPWAAVSRQTIPRSTVRIKSPEVGKLSCQVSAIQKIYAITAAEVA